MTYAVTITVPAAPRLGACTWKINASSSAAAETEALRLFHDRWAVGAHVRAVARPA